MERAEWDRVAVFSSGQALQGVKMASKIEDLGRRRKMIRRIDHISIAVKDLEKARRFFLDILGGRELYSAPLESQHFRWTTIELGSSCLLELIDPISKEGFLHRFLEQRGEGPHHITIQVHDIEEFHRHLQKNGISTFGYGEPISNWKEFFVHPKDAFGTLLQFAEFDPLEWINPGYVPATYREFIKEKGEETPGHCPVSLERKRTPDGKDGLIIRKGRTELHLSMDDIKELSMQMKKMGMDCPNQDDDPG
jgi:methylmalonyl-CoA epimerase